MGIKNKGNGFTLIELMIVVAIVAILALLAYPAYNDQVRKTARKHAEGQVLDIAGQLEQIHSQLLKYSWTGGDQTGDRYTLSVSVPNDGASFTITATPTGDQKKDSCGVMTYTNDGIWTFTKDGTSVAVSDCL